MFVAAAPARETVLDDRWPRRECDPVSARARRGGRRRVICPLEKIIIKEDRNEYVWGKRRQRAGPQDNTVATTLYTHRT